MFFFFGSNDFYNKNQQREPQGENQQKIKRLRGRHVHLTAGTHRSKRPQNLNGVKFGKQITKWGNSDDNLLNRVISVKKIKLGGKNWNLLVI